MHLSIRQPATTRHRLPISNHAPWQPKLFTKRPLIVLRGDPVWHGGVQTLLLSRPAPMCTMCTTSARRPQTTRAASCRQLVVGVAPLGLASRMSFGHQSVPRCSRTTSFQTTSCSPASERPATGSSEFAHVSLTHYRQRARLGHLLGRQAGCVEPPPAEPARRTSSRTTAPNLRSNHSTEPQVEPNHTSRRTTMRRNSS